MEILQALLPLRNDVSFGSHPRHWFRPWASAMLNANVNFAGARSLRWRCLPYPQSRLNSVTP